MKEEIRNIIITAILFIIALINPFNNELISKRIIYNCIFNYWGRSSNKCNQKIYLKVRFLMKNF